MADQDGKEDAEHADPDGQHRRLSVQRQDLRHILPVHVRPSFPCVAGLHGSVSARGFLPRQMKTGGFSGSRVVGDRNTTSAAIPSGAYGGQAIRPGHPACPGDQHSATHRVLHANLVPEHSPALLSSGMAVSYHQLPTVSIGFLIVLFSVKKHGGRMPPCVMIPVLLYRSPYLAAVASISTRPPFGSAETSTQDRAGLWSPKNPA